ncbi:MAG TPA: PhzF family phenazine biosynthesis protein [Mycobacteriales bacterium]
MSTLHVLRVFVGADGTFGNPLGVFLAGTEVPADRRPAVAADLGFSETVFVLDPADGVVEIHTPAVQLPFAGHPLVGAGWLLSEIGGPVDALRPPAGVVPTWSRDGEQWIRGRAEWAPPMELREYPRAAEVDALTVPEKSMDAWAWLDQPAGLVRSRVFVPEAGVPEDEATGSAAVRLVTALGRAVEIRQGAGSRLLARPGPDGTAEVGGTVVLDEVRDYQVPG